MSETVSPWGVPPSVAIKSVGVALRDPRRWKILAALAGGEALMVAELAEVIGMSKYATSKHVILLRKAGLVVQGRNRLYQVPPQFLADKAERVVDFGCCLLRLKTIA